MADDNAFGTRLSLVRQHLRARVGHGPSRIIARTQSAPDQGRQRPLLVLLLQQAEEAGAGQRGFSGTRAADHSHKPIAIDEAIQRRLLVIAAEKELPIPEIEGSQARERLRFRQPCGWARHYGWASGAPVSRAPSASGLGCSSLMKSSSRS